jgi:hypothetical protein
MKSFLHNSIVYGSKNNKNPIFNFVEDGEGDCIVNLDSYAVIPLNVLFNPFKLIWLYFDWKRHLRNFEKRWILKMPEKGAKK